MDMLADLKRMIEQNEASFLAPSGASSYNKNPYPMKNIPLLKEEEYKEYKETFCKRPNIPIQNAPIDGTRKDIWYVAPGEIGCVTDTSSMKALATYDAGPCIIIALHNPKRKITVLAHKDPISSTKLTLISMLNQVGEDQQLEGHILGGNPLFLGDYMNPLSCYGMPVLKGVLEVLEKFNRPNIALKTVDIAPEAPAQLLIDCNGRATDAFDPKKLANFRGIKETNLLDNIGKSAIMSYNGAFEDINRGLTERFYR